MWVQVEQKRVEYQRIPSPNHKYLIFRLVTITPQSRKIKALVEKKIPPPHVGFKRILWAISSTIKIHILKVAYLWDQQTIY